MYGGGFDILATLAAKVLPFGLFETRRLVGAAIGLIGLFVTWRLGRRLGGPLAGLIALVLLAACPLYYGHMFINAKDGPFAAAMAIALLGIVRAFDEYPRATPRNDGAVRRRHRSCDRLARHRRLRGGRCGVAARCSLFAVRSRESALKPALAECGSFLTAFIPAQSSLISSWDWFGRGAWCRRSIPFRAVEYFSHVFEKPWRELFDGRLIPIPNMPRSYVPTLFALKLPELMLALGICGSAGAIIAHGAKGPQRRRPARCAFLQCCSRQYLPVLVTVAARPYHVQRHPPFRVRGAAVRRARRPCRGMDRAAAAAIRPASPSPRAAWRSLRALLPRSSTWCGCIRTNTPITITSSAASRGAQPNFMLDYWGLSLTQASRRLLAYIAEHHRDAAAVGNGRSRYAGRIRRSPSRLARNSRRPGIPRVPTSP